MNKEIWVHKQSEVIEETKPKGMLSALYVEYVRKDLVDELIEWADMLLSTSDTISIEDYKLAEKAIESIRGNEQS